MRRRWRVVCDSSHCAPCLVLSYKETGPLLPILMFLPRPVHAAQVATFVAHFSLASTVTRLRGCIAPYRAVCAAQQIFL